MRTGKTLIRPGDYSELISIYSKTRSVKRPLSRRPKIVFQYQLSLNAGQKYCRMLGEHSAVLLAFIKLPFVIKIYVLSIFEWPYYTGFTVILLLLLTSRPAWLFHRFIIPFSERSCSFCSLESTKSSAN